MQALQIEQVTYQLCGSYGENIDQGIFLILGFLTLVVVRRLVRWGEVVPMVHRERIDAGARGVDLNVNSCVGQDE